MPRALITGIAGQDGSYLSELLLAKGYEVHGIVRRVALEDPENRLSRLASVRSHLHLHAAALESYGSIHRILDTVRPHECYHLAAHSFVSYSFDEEFSTLQTNINGTHCLLLARTACFRPCARWSRSAVFILPVPAKCSEKPTKCRRASGPIFTRAIVARLMECTP